MVSIGNTYKGHLKYTSKCTSHQPAMAAPSLGRLKQRDHKFKVSLGYVDILYGIFFIAFLQLHQISLLVCVTAKFDCQLDSINKHLNN